MAKSASAWVVTAVAVLVLDKLPYKVLEARASLIVIVAAVFMAVAPVTLSIINCIVSFDSTMLSVKTGTATKTLVAPLLIVTVPEVAV